MNERNFYKKLLIYGESLLQKISSFTRYVDWRSWDKPKKVSFVINLCIGILISIGFNFITHMQFMENLFNSTVDKVIKQEATEFIKTSEKCFKQSSSDDRDCKKLRQKISSNIIFIDIDHDTYCRWGEPLFIPRNQIAHFLKLADMNNAKVVALDILLDYSSHSPGEDAELKKVLEDITKRKSELKVIFPISKSSVDGRIKKNIFDTIIDKNPNFYRGFPYSSFSKSDRVVRYIRYYDIAKGDDGKNVVLWGVPVLSVALFTNDFSKLKELEPVILEDYKHQRSKKYTAELTNKGLLEIGNNELFSNRIRFALLPPGTLSDQGNLFAERILPDEVEALQQELKDKIVIIGTSSPDKEGWYPTPVGDMAGFYILGNAMNVLIGDWQVRDAPLWIGFLINLIIIIFASYMLVYSRPSVARVVSTIFAFILLIPTTYYFFKEYGFFINTIFLFLNLLIPVMAMGWHNIFEKIKRLIQTKLRLLVQH
jgi:CHASE2 domain-containing sensor protein